MPPPRASNAYPVEFRAALNRAIAQGELFIPHEKPAAFRLMFYGYTSALRRDGEPELADSCSFYLKHDPPSGLVIKLKESTPTAKIIRDALGGISEKDISSPPDDTPSEMDLLFNRIAGKKP